MILKIIESTDNNHIGIKVDSDMDVIDLGDALFSPTKKNDLGNGKYTYSNSNYILTLKVVSHD